MTRVAVVSPVRLHREGLASLLARDPRISVVGDAAPDELHGLRDTPVEIVLLDAADGAQTRVRQLVETMPAAKIVAVVVDESDDAVVAWAEAGVAGYVDRRASLDELLDTVHSVARGEVSVSPSVAATLLRRVATLAGGAPASSPLPPLTKRELEIVALIEEGLSNKEIASRLCIGLPTVKNHVHNVLEKLNVRRRADAAEVVRVQRLRAHARPLRDGGERIAD